MRCGRRVWLFESLNVGCGFDNSADVSVDLHRGVTVHRFGNQPIPTRAFNNFVCADAQHLPFRNDGFKFVVSNHTLEHVSDPCMMLSELLRVSSYHVTVRCPHRLGDRLINWRENRGAHVNFFNRRWFHKFAEKNHVAIRSWVSIYGSYPHDYLPLFSVPREITVDLFKSQTVYLYENSAKNYSETTQP